MEKAAKNKKIIALYIAITIALTWLLQFMPMIMGLDIENTSISSFDFASLFFGIGGVIPTLTGIIFVFVFYTKDGIKVFYSKQGIHSSYIYLTCFNLCRSICDTDDLERAWCR